MIKQISDAEWELMKIIWNNGGIALYNQIINSLEAKNKMWQKNTVITLLSQLINKGLLQTNKIGHRNEYIAIVSEGDYQAFFEYIHNTRKRGKAVLGALLNLLVG